MKNLLKYFETYIFEMKSSKLLIIGQTCVEDAPIHILVVFYFGEGRSMANQVAPHALMALDVLLHFLIS